MSPWAAGGAPAPPASRTVKAAGVGSGRGRVGWAWRDVRDTEATGLILSPSHSVIELSGGAVPDACRKWEKFASP